MIAKARLTPIMRKAQADGLIKTKKVRKAQADDLIKTKRNKCQIPEA